ncbi:MAG: RNA polymerase sigma factor [Nitrospiraceae bacterium]
MTLTYTQIAELFLRYREELIRRLVGMVQSQEIAADIVQDTYLKLLKLGAGQGVEQPRALLHRIAGNLAIDYLRREKIKPTGDASFEDAMQVPSHAPSPERILIGKRRFRACLQSIDSLPPRTRQAFLLCRVYGYSYREIAAHMRISEGAVEKLLMRALKHCCEALDAHDADE